MVYASGNSLVLTEAVLEKRLLNELFVLQDQKATRKMCNYIDMLALTYRNPKST